MSVYSSTYYQNSCDTATPAFNCDPCGPREKARVRSAGFLKANHIITDYTNAVQWNDAVANNKVYVLPFVSGKVTAEPIIEKGYGDIEDQIVGYKFKAEIEDPNYAQNALFWNAIKNDKNRKFIYRTETKIHVSETRVSIKPQAPVEDDINKNVVWKIEISWTQEGVMLPFDIPAGVFDSCFTPV